MLFYPPPCATAARSTPSPSAISPAAITNQPQDVTVAAGATATFTVGASGTPPLLYQWSVNSAPISGATCSSYAVLSASLCNSGALYSVTVSNLAGGHHQPAAGRDRRRWRN